MSHAPTVFVAEVDVPEHMTLGAAQEGVQAQLRYIATKRWIDAIYNGQVPGVTLCKQHFVVDGVYGRTHVYRHTITVYPPVVLPKWEVKIQPPPPPSPLRTALYAVARTWRDAVKRFSMGKV
jgi:hypothetical protein